MNYNQELIEKNIVCLNVSNPFTWSSGLRSPIYCDNRLILGYPNLRKFVANQLAAIVKQNFNNIDAIMGTSTAGIPHATSVADLLDLPCGYVRSKPKNYGASNQIEGFNVENKNIVVIEDLISTSKSVKEVVDALKKQKANVVGVVAIFSYNMLMSKEYFETEEIKYFTLSDIDSFMHYCVESEKLTLDDLNQIKLFLDDPQKWFKS